MEARLGLCPPWIRALAVFPTPPPLWLAATDEPTDESLTRVEPSLVVGEHDNALFLPCFGLRP